MATEELIVRAVRAGGDRQAAHEVIRRHSVAAARAMKDDGTRNDLLERLAADRTFGVPIDDLRAALDPSPLRRPRAAAGRRVSRGGRRAAAGRNAMPARCRNGRGARMTGVATTALPLHRPARGKVRDVYEVDADRLLLVATDRVSAFDVVMRETVPYKGAVLTQLTAWWLRQLERDVAAPHDLGRRRRDRARGAGARRRTATCCAAARCSARRTEVFPVECVIRGYIAGSAWKEYRASGTLAGEPLPPGCARATGSTRRVFSPATKAETGHDENITIARMAGHRGRRGGDGAGAPHADGLRRGCAIAEPRGIIIADTKFEFGVRDGRIMLVDEVLTPDSSRFWPADDYAPGRRSRASTSSRCATISTPSAGRPVERRGPPPPLPPEPSSTRRARGTSTRIRRITGTAPRTSLALS